MHKNTQTIDKIRGFLYVGNVLLGKGDEWRGNVIDRLSDEMVVGQGGDDDDNTMTKEKGQIKWKVKSNTK